MVNKYRFTDLAFKEKNSTAFKTIHKTCELVSITEAYTNLQC